MSNKGSTAQQPQPGEAPPSKTSRSTALSHSHFLSPPNSWFGIFGNNAYGAIGSLLACNASCSNASPSTAMRNGVKSSKGCATGSRSPAAPTSYRLRCPRRQSTRPGTSSYCTPVVIRNSALRCSDASCIMCPPRRCYRRPRLRKDCGAVGRSAARANASAHATRATCRGCLHSMRR